MKFQRFLLLGFVFFLLGMMNISSQEMKIKKSRKGSRKGNKGGREGGSDGGGSKGLGKSNPQRMALESWSSSLVPEVDYNASGWRYIYRSVSTTDYFYAYCKKLSNLFKKINAEVNFVMVGACDGVSDPLIKFHFLKQNHWKGVFVEPVSINVRDLIKFLNASKVLDRSYIIRAAATAHCENPTINMERPLYEEKAMKENKTVAHWLRRQIGSILPKDRDHARPEWTVETVQCKTSQDILRDWSKAVPVVHPNGKSTKSIRRRPHILKIDVEGHDFEVLTGFINENTPTSELPLLVCFEAKSIAEKFPKLKDILEKKGYVVSNFGQDGFAMLKADHILATKKKKSASEDISQTGFGESGPEEDQEFEM